MQKGRFITLEGGEGAGKSTQLSNLADALKSGGINVLTTREPGGAPGAEEIRELLVNGETERWSPMAEVLLHTAARAEHLAKTVWPALEKGAWVISDRFADSTTAYQGFGHGIDLETLDALYKTAFGDFKPDLTLIFDLPVEVGLERAGSRQGGEDRYERMGTEFHQRLRDGFLNIAAQEPDRCAVIDATANIETVTQAISKIVSDRLGVQL